MMKNLKLISQQYRELGQTAWMSKLAWLYTGTNGLSLLVPADKGFISRYNKYKNSITYRMVHSKLTQHRVPMMYQMLLYSLNYLLHAIALNIVYFQLFEMKKKKSFYVTLYIMF
jgi:hypothetical protein